MPSNGERETRVTIQISVLVSSLICRQLLSILHVHWWVSVSFINQYKI